MVKQFQKKNMEVKDILNKPENLVILLIMNMFNVDIILK